MALFEHTSYDPQNGAHQQQSGRLLVTVNADALLNKEINELAGLEKFP